MLSLAESVGGRVLLLATMPFFPIPLNLTIGYEIDVVELAVEKPPTTLIFNRMLSLIRGMALIDCFAIWSIL